MTPGSDNNRVLALLPHPDDMEILCAGTLLRLRDLGFEIHVATMTAGDKGSATLPPDEIAAIRRDEARQGAAAVGSAGYRCLEFPDCGIVFDNDARRRVTGHLRAVDPFLVITTPPDDYMLDHEMTSRLVRDACFNAPIRNFPTDGAAGPSSGIPFLYYTDAIEGQDIFGNSARVTCVVDISGQIDGKIAALKCHASQRAWLQKQHEMDNYIESMTRWSARRGGQIGAAYGEAFCQHRGHPHPREDRLALLLTAALIPGQPA